MHCRIEFLNRLPKGGVVVEVGAWLGDFSKLLWEVLTPERLVLIDTWEDYQGINGSQAMLTVQKQFSGNPHVELWRGQSSEMIPRLGDGSVSVAYVDADHRYESVLADLEALRPKMAPGGWLCGHDYCCVDQFGVVRAVAVFLDRHPELRLDILMDYPPFPVLGSDRQNFEPEVSYNDFGIAIR